MVASKKPFGPLSLGCHLGHSTMQLRIPVWWAIFDQLHHRFLGLGKCRKFMHQPIHRFNNKIWRFCTKHVIMWPFFVFRYVASLSFNATIIMEGNIEMKHFLGVIWILQKHPRKDPHPPAAANPLKTKRIPSSWAESKSLVGLRFSCFGTHPGTVQFNNTSCGFKLSTVGPVGV